MTAPPWGAWGARGVGSARGARVRGAEVELLNHFLDARDSGHISEEERAQLSHNAKPAIKAETV